METLKSFLLLLTLFTAIYPQSDINFVEGHVRDMNSYTPVSYANVYISGTTLGTTTDEAGYYKISNVPQGKNTLVVSITGYKASNQEIYLFKNSQITKDFMLVAKVYDLGNVDVVGSAEEWKEQLQFFKKYFLGATPNSEKCKIENEIEINFIEDERYFRASVPNTLKLINDAVGYEVDCVLDHFVYDKEKKIYHFKVFTEFEDIADSADENILFYQMMRRKGTYLGSPRHLLLTLIRDKIVEERFNLTMWEDPEWPRFEEITDVDDLLTYNTFSNTYTLNFSDYLKIEYVSMLQGGETTVTMTSRTKRVRHESGYIDYSAVNEERAEPEQGQKSWLSLPDGKAEIDVYGNFINPDEFILRGDYGKLGVADMLPKYVKYDAQK